MAPAIALARAGFVVDEDLADSLPKAAKRLAVYPASRAMFLHPDGSPRRRGERLDEHDLAATLQRDRRRRPRRLLQGPIAAEIVAAVDGAGGHMSLDDLASYRALERVPVSGTYRGHDDRLDAAAVLGRHSRHRDPQHSRGLSAGEPRPGLGRRKSM